MKIKYYTRENNRGRISDYAKFNEIEFYKDGNYYRHNKYRYLHIYIYEYFNNVKVDTTNKDKNLREVIHHKDFNKENNDISNLQCMTNSEHNTLHHKNKKVSLQTRKKLSKANKNKKHSEEHKQKLSGEKNGKSKLKTEEVNKIKDLYKTGNYTQNQLGKIFNVVHGQISKIVNNRSRVKC